MIDLDLDTLEVDSLCSLGTVDWVEIADVKSAAGTTAFNAAGSLGSVVW